MYKVLKCHDCAIRCKELFYCCWWSLLEYNLVGPLQETETTMQCFILIKFLDLVYPQYNQSLFESCISVNIAGISCVIPHFALNIQSNRRLAKMWGKKLYNNVINLLQSNWWYYEVGVIIFSDEVLFYKLVSLIVRNSLRFTIPVSFDDVNLLIAKFKPISWFSSR